MEKETKKHLFKGLAIAALTLGLLIFIPIIGSIISERSAFQTEVVQEVSEKWGDQQTLYGPFILLEYRVATINEKNEVLYQRERALFSPTTQTITGSISTTTKKRSLYQVTLYNTDLLIEAQFEAQEKLLASLGIQGNPEITSKKILYGISDTKGLSEALALLNTPGKVFTLNDNPIIEQIPFLSLDYTAEESTPTAIKLPLKLKGSSNLQFLAHATTTKVNIKSDYHDVKYIGNYLPEESEKGKEQANSTWNIYQPLPLNTTSIRNLTFDKYTFGIEFLELNNFYSKIDRSIKYALLFVGLTFIVFYFLENIKNLKINLIQYALIGFAIFLNYILLLSFSEYLGFSISYVLSTLSTIILITIFTWKISKNKSSTGTIFGLLLLLYGLLYFLIELKETALLVGSISIFIILAVLMQFSIKMTASKKEEE
ncbi:cell envelope integrity protein CreD [Myroides sp. TSA_177.3]|uniref:cell envelope integrity protein CreD n=1 Tax=Myroides sp. TSA_177.3 TaxID=3415650 RepID=UPI0040463C87